MERLKGTWAFCAEGEKKFYGGPALHFEGRFNKTLLRQTTVFSLSYHSI